LRMKVQVFRKRTDYFILAGLVLLFGYFACFEEVRELSDSFQYLNQFVTREPGYSLLLKGGKILFGESYKLPLGMIQNILAVISIYWLYVRVTNIFKLPVVFEVSVSGLLVIPHVITPLVSQSGMIITNSVLTEGITFSLYYIWMGMLLSLLLQWYGKKQGRSILLCGIVSVVLALTRGQFLLCMVMWLLVSVYILRKQNEIKKIVLVCLGFIVLLVGKTYFTKSYNYLESGIFTNTVAGKPMMLANALYVSDLEDGIDIEDVELQNAYENMICRIDEERLSVKYVDGNIIEKAQFHESGHEIINFDIIDPEIEAVIKKKDGITAKQYMHLMVKMDEYAGEIFKDILPNILPEYIQNYFVIASLGFVRSIAVDRAILPLYALVMYLLAVVLIVVLLRKDNTSNAAKFMIVTFLLIIGTVFGTSIMIECVARYMIYNFPFFYIAWMALLTELWTNKKGIKANGL